MHRFHRYTINTPLGFYFTKRTTGALLGVQIICGVGEIRTLEGLPPGTLAVCWLRPLTHDSFILFVKYRISPDLHHLTICQDAYLFKCFELLVPIISKYRSMSFTLSNLTSLPDILGCMPFSAKICAKLLSNAGDALVNPSFL